MQFIFHLNVQISTCSLSLATHKKKQNESYALLKFSLKILGSVSRIGRKSRASCSCENLSSYFHQRGNRNLQHVKRQSYYIFFKDLNVTSKAKNITVFCFHYRVFFLNYKRSRCVVYKYMNSYNFRYKSKYENNFQGQRYAPNTSFIFECTETVGSSTVALAMSTKLNLFSVINYLILPRFLQLLEDQQTGDG